MKRLIPYLIPLLLVFSAMAQAAAPLDGVANVWLLDENGQLYGSVNTGNGEWTTQATKVDSSTARVFIDGGGSQLVDADLSGPVEDSVIVNQTPSSYPLPISAGRPPISIVGLGEAIEDSGFGQNRPRVTVEARAAGRNLANPDISDQTIAVTMTAYPAPNLGGDYSGMLRLRWTLSIDDNGNITNYPQQEMSTTAGKLSHTIYLARNAIHTIDAWSYQSQTNRDSQVKTWVLEISGADPLRDGPDQDGIPDVAEAEFGLDPYSTDVNHDRDDNGIPDFLEVLCLNYSQTLINAGVDTDQDTASDCEEILRGTNPNDTQNILPDRPAMAASVYSPEHLLKGGVFEDAGLTSKKGMGRLRVASVPGLAFYDSAELLDDAGVEALINNQDPPPNPALTVADVPDYLHGDLVSAQLAAGDFLPSIRLPADRSLVVYVEEPQATLAEQLNNPPPPLWAARAWIYARQSLTPAVVTPTLIGDGATWVTGSDWLELFGDYLSMHLVQAVNVPVSPASGNAIALLDAAVAYYHDGADGALTLLGDPREPPAQDAVTALRLAMAPGYQEDQPDTDIPGRSLDYLHQEYLALLQYSFLYSYAEASTLLANIDAIYANPAGFSGETTLHSMAALMQPVPQPGNCCLQSRYLASLLTRIPLTDFLLLPTQADAADPLADYDGEGVLNYLEMLHPPPLGSNPLLANTDGDDYSDDYDPCPNSAGNACLNQPYQAMDSDGDGVIDSLDNCMNTYNPDQANAGTDAFGDACLRAAAIVSPNSNLAIFTGQSVHFSSAESDAASPPLSYLWNFDGAAPNSNAASPGDIQFNTVGEFDVTLVTTDGGGSWPADTRRIRVMDHTPAPTVSLPAEMVVEQGVLALFTAVATPGSGIIQLYDWDFGDGGNALGNPVMHSYAEEGIYNASVMVFDSGNRHNSTQTTVLVVDAVPHAAIAVDADTGLAPFTVQFSDISFSGDPVVARSWDFDDGSPLDAGINPSHTFTSPGTYQVVLTVEDDDGSIGTASLPIEVLAMPDGDLTGDGNVNAGDLLRMQRIVLGLIDPPTAADIAHGDLHPVGDPDGVLDMSDLVLLTQLVLGSP